MRTITEANLVAYLRAKGFQETTHPKLVKNSVTFFFEDSPSLNDEIDTFFSRKTTIEPLAMTESLRVTKAQIVDLKVRGRRSGGGSDE